MYSLFDSSIYKYYNKGTFKSEQEPFNLEICVDIHVYAILYLSKSTRSNIFTVACRWSILHWFQDWNMTSQWYEIYLLVCYHGFKVQGLSAISNTVAFERL